MLNFWLQKEEVEETEQQLEKARPDKQLFDRKKKTALLADRDLRVIMEESPDKKNLKVSLNPP